MSGDGTNDLRVQWPVDLSHMRPEDAAEWVVARYGDGSMPIVPERIARRMGINVYALTDKDRNSAYPGPDGKLWIVIDTKDSIYRQRFAIAHALGHIVMRHDDPPLESWNSFANDAPDPRDRAANLFAASLLVPTEKLRWCVTSGWMRNGDHIVKTLGVPLGLIAFRYEQLRRGR
jgi:Zn-dependent peptidase ImmA (M78 family)